MNTQLLIVLLSAIHVSISEKPHKRYNIQETNPLDYADYDFEQRNQKLQQLKMLEDNKRRRGPMLMVPSIQSKLQDKINVKQELDNLNCTFVWQPMWPSLTKRLGAVSAVALDNSENAVVFHRANRVWKQGSFDLQTNDFLEGDLGPIPENTIIAFDRKTGKIAYEYGKNLFYLPHGLTIDKDNNMWVTDVALHQVMKLNPETSPDKPLMILGKKFIPGKNQETFCKPTSVAVLPNGDFFVADGYCNARIIKFAKNGKRILSWGENTFQGQAYTIAPPNYFAVPHALTLALDLGLICVADRENGRVQCFQTTNGTFHSQYHSPIMGDRIFSVSYTSANGGQLFVVNGPLIRSSDLNVNTDHEVKGFVIDMQSGKVISKFGPNNKMFSNPHDLIVTPNGLEVYVAEIGPNKIHKFLSVDYNTTVNANLKPTATLDDTNQSLHSPAFPDKAEPGATALLVVSLVVIFGILAFGLALLISRRRKRGCLPFGVRNRRHAWDFPTVKSDFKLGNLLDRNKKGFEKLEQEASEEEANMLSSAQFA